MKPALIALSILLAGCSTNPVRTGNDLGVIVNRGDAGIHGAAQAAEAHCAKYARRAVYKGPVTAFDLAYDCVP